MALSALCAAAVAVCLSALLPALLPAAKAVEAAQSKLNALSQSELKDVLRYHVIPRPVSIPRGLKLDSPYETAFKGHTVQFKEV